NIKSTGGGLPPEKLFSYMRQAASALDYLNACNHIVDGDKRAFRHCWVNARSLFLCGGRLKLGEFGMVQMVDAARSPVDNTIFKPGWGPPEAFKESVICDRSDQYALAIAY